NIQMYTHKCLNCQIVKESKKGLEYKKIIEKMMIKFLHSEIYVNYEILCEILTDNDTNLIEEVVRHFMSQLQTRYYRTILYHSQMNRKIKYLNEILNNMLIKYL
ncbi:hypothetical protein BDBG_16718, partial [Blastomyces gilchristii SLH14081]